MQRWLELNSGTHTKRAQRGSQCIHNSFSFCVVLENKMTNTESERNVQLFVWVTSTGIFFPPRNAGTEFLLANVHLSLTNERHLYGMIWSDRQSSSQSKNRCEPTLVRRFKQMLRHLNQRVQRLASSEMRQWMLWGLFSARAVIRDQDWAQTSST